MSAYDDNSNNNISDVKYNIVVHSMRVVRLIFRRSVMVTARSAKGFIVRESRQLCGLRSRDLYPYVHVQSSGLGSDRAAN